MLELWKPQYKNIGPRMRWRDLSTMMFYSQSNCEKFIRERQKLDRYGDYTSLLFRAYEITDWKVREQHMFDQNIYKLPPWYAEPFWYDYTRPAETTYHYAHISLNDPSMIAFTASEEHGKRDRQTAMRPGKYLSKFFAGVLTPKQIAFYAEWFATGTKPPPDIGEYVLKFATTPEEIVDVYGRGPQSCMDKRHFRDPDLNPTRVYGAGDLAIAYLERTDGSKKVIARTLCWPERKAFGRVYPTPGVYENDGFPSQSYAQGVQDTLRILLKKEGYTSVGERQDVLCGAKLQRIPWITSGLTTYVMPYLDNEYMVHETDDKQFVLTVHERESYVLPATFCGGDTSGRVYERQRYRGKPGGDVDWASVQEGRQQGDNAYCDDPDEDDFDENTTICSRCEDECDEDDTHTVYNGWRAGRGGTNPQEWCSHCYENRTFYCEGTNENYTDQFDSVQVEGQTYNLAWAEYNGLFYCEGSDEYFFDGDYDQVEMENGETWSSLYFDDNGFHCSYDDKNYKNEDASWKWPGFPADLDDENITFDERMEHVSSNKNPPYVRQEYKSSINNWRAGYVEGHNPWRHPLVGLARIQTVYAPRDVATSSQWLQNTGSTAELLSWTTSASVCYL